MKKCIISILRAVIFLSLLVVSLYYINKMLLPKYISSNSNWPTTTTYNQFYEMEEDTVDVFFFGSSLMVNAFSPQTIYNEYGIRRAETGPQLEDNIKALSQWKAFNPQAVKRRRCYKKKINDNENE